MPIEREEKIFGFLCTCLSLLTVRVAEFAASYLCLPRGRRPPLMLPGVRMVGVVATGFMDARRGPALDERICRGGRAMALGCAGLGQRGGPLARIVCGAECAS